MAKRYPAKLKFQVVLELLQGDKTAGQIAKAYGVHPNSINKWKPLSSPVLPNVAEDWPYPVGYFNNQGHNYIPPEE